MNVRQLSFALLLSTPLLACSQPPAPPAPPISLHDPALQHRPTGLQVLADDIQAKPVQTSERSQVRTSEARPPVSEFAS